ncbi:hypothetical protein BJ741DRAFT_137064 [Chytriomyces cf. hyalinus JEL632]|nr:hypothetical protein BJ741DRAFT_137064 [Chytriomyces cf. hyalinus JEL632]
MLSGNTVIAISGDEDDPLPAPGNALTHTLKRSAPPSPIQSAPKQIRSDAAIAAPYHPVPVVTGSEEVELTEEDPHVLLWIENNSCRDADYTASELRNLKVIGVFSTGEAAWEKKEEIMDEYEAMGYGDITVKPRMGDPVSLVIKPCDMFGFEAPQQSLSCATITGPSTSVPAVVESLRARAKPHVLLRFPTDERGQYDEEEDWNDLEVIGVFSTEQAADEKWGELAYPDDEESSWSDEYQADSDDSDRMEWVMKPCDMFGFEGL